ncbi:MAG: T9SS type A sorting domain-containing protein [Chitinophagales bacterium]
MKKVFFTLSLLGAAVFANAQACGGTSTCTPPTPTGTAGLRPTSDSLPCQKVGQATTQLIKFENFTSFGSFGAVNSLKIDSINNLPPGLCWKTNVANNTFAGGATGCIEVSGTPTGAPGQYKLRIHITADIGAGHLQQSGDAEALTSLAGTPLRYYARLVSSSATTCPCLDTVGGKTNLYIAYNGSETSCGPLAVNNIDKDVQNMTVTPNPFGTAAEVVFSSEKSANYTLKLTNLVGAEVSAKSVEAHVGENRITFERNQISAGVYFMTIGNSNGSVTRKVVIE